MKYQIGEMVKTVKGSVVKGEGPIHEIVRPSQDLQLLWGDNELHYLVKDIQSGDFISVTERGIEKR